MAHPLDTLLAIARGFHCGGVVRGGEHGLRTGEIPAILSAPSLPRAIEPGENPATVAMNLVIEAGGKVDAEQFEAVRHHLDKRTKR